MSWLGVSISRSARPVGSGVAGWRLHARRRPAKGRWSMGSSQSSVKSCAGPRLGRFAGLPRVGSGGVAPCVGPEVWAIAEQVPRTWEKHGRGTCICCVCTWPPASDASPPRPRLERRSNCSTKQPLTSVNCHSWSRPMPQCSLLTYQICSSMPSQVFKIRL